MACANWPTAAGSVARTVTCAPSGRARAALASAILSVGAVGASGYAQSEEHQEQAYRCAVHQEGCVHPADGFEAWLGGMATGIATELLLVALCALAGLGLARATRRRPADERKAALLPPD